MLKFLLLLLLTWLNYSLASLPLEVDVHFPTPYVFCIRSVHYCNCCSSQQTLAALERNPRTSLEREYTRWTLSLPRRRRHRSFLSSWFRPPGLLFHMEMLPPQSELESASTEESITRLPIGFVPDRFISRSLKERQRQMILLSEDPFPSCHWLRAGIALHAFHHDLFKQPFTTYVLWIDRSLVPASVRLRLRLQPQRQRWWNHYWINTGSCLYTQWVERPSTYELHISREDESESDQVSYQLNPPSSDSARLPVRGSGALQALGQGLAHAGGAVVGVVGAVAGATGGAVGGLFKPKKQHSSEDVQSEVNET